MLDIDPNIYRGAPTLEVFKALHDYFPPDLYGPFILEKYVDNPTRAFQNALLRSTVEIRKTTDPSHQDKELNADMEAELEAQAAANKNTEAPVFPFIKRFSEYHNHRILLLGRFNVGRVIREFIPGSDLNVCQLDGENKPAPEDPLMVELSTPSVFTASEITLLTDAAQRIEQIPRVDS